MKNRELEKTLTGYKTCNMIDKR